jgi:alkyl hydroperoxide reductase subunit D
MSAIVQKTIDSLFAEQTTTIGRDLKLNLTKILDRTQPGQSVEPDWLSPQDIFFALLAAATSVEHLRLATYATAQLEMLGASGDEIREARESAAIVGMLNTYYRFRHFVGNPDEYRIAGLRMTALARPVLGKHRFEMLAFVVSVLNGCETCTRSHEKALKDGGATSEKIHELARLAAVVKGLKAMSGSECKPDRAQP